MAEKNKEKHHYELKAGLQQNRNTLISNFSQNNTFPEDYQNDFTFYTNTYYLGGKYQLTASNVIITIEPTLLNYQNTLQKEQSTYSNQQLAFSPKLTTSWQFSDNSKIEGIYSFSIQNSPANTIVPNYILTGFRNFSRGLNTPEFLQTSSTYLNYRLGNFSDRLFISIFAGYTKNHNFMSSNALVKQDFVHSQKQILKDREIIHSGGYSEYYIRLIKSNLKLNSHFTETHFQNIINDKERTVKTRSFYNKIELQTAFKSFWEMAIGASLSKSFILQPLQSTYSENEISLSSFINLSKKMKLEITSTRHQFFGKNTKNTIYHFIDLEGKYEVSSNFNLYLSAKNLSNTKTFTNYILSDSDFIQTEIPLLNRFILLGVNYRFK